MVSIIRNRVCETSTTTGTGAFTLDGALPGYQTFDDVSVGGSDDFRYLIEAVDANGVPTGEWEVGLGTMPSSTTSLTRTAVIESSAGFSSVSFSAGTKRVWMIASNQEFLFVGAVVKKSADMTAQNFTSETAISWNTDWWDSDGFTGGGSAITIPASWEYNQVRCSLQVGLANITADEWVKLAIKKNTTDQFGNAYGTFESGNTSPAYSVETPIINCTGGDTFTAYIQVEADTSVDIVAAKSFFQLQVIQ